MKPREDLSCSGITLTILAREIYGSPKTDNSWSRMRTSERLRALRGVGTLRTSKALQFHTHYPALSIIMLVYHGQCIFPTWRYKPPFRNMSNIDSAPNPGLKSDIFK